MSIRRKVAVGILAVLSIVVLAVAGISFKASSSLLAPDSDAVNPPPAGLPVEEIAFSASDGVRLSGWYIPAKTCRANDCPPAPVVINSPGRGATRSSFDGEMQRLHDAGFATLSFDYRASGTSERGVLSTAGANERLDLTAAIDEVTERRGADASRIAVYGKSQGASTAMLVASEDQRVGAVVDESGFSRLADVVGYNFELETGLPAFPFAPIAVKMAEVRAGVDLDDVAAIETVSRISPRPLLIVHATGDTRVRYAESEKLFAAASEPKQFWTLDGSEHADALDADPAGWETNVLAFLQRWAQQPAPPAGG